jgi:hypothetical protein
MLVDTGESLNDRERQDLLQTSELIQNLTNEFFEKLLYAVWRIIALAEIPFTGELDYTKMVIRYIEKCLATEKGFSLTGKKADLLPCYNAMLVEALSKMGYAHLPSVKNGVDWIRQYQPFERNAPVLWQEAATKKYGGCLKSTPCYIGVAKSLKALLYYNNAIGNPDNELTDLINKGVDYILCHSLYKRLSNAEPINGHIMDLAFPPSYHLNIVELLEIAYQTGNLTHPACADALAFIKAKRTSNGWKPNFIYKNDGYMPFDKRATKGEWISYLLNKYFGAAQ